MTEEMRKYVGSRYVPIFGRKGEESIEWDNTKPYEPLSVVLYGDDSYTSRQYVPIGAAITNDEYWAKTGNYNAHIENIEQALPISSFSSSDTVADALIDLGNLLPYNSFDNVNTVKKYIDDNITLIDNQLDNRAVDFDNVSSMKASTILENGMIVHTLGFHSQGDGGAAWYVISSTGTANEMDVIACGSFYANLVIADSCVTPEMFGAYGDGTHDDTDAIKRAITFIAETGLTFDPTTDAIGGKLHFGAKIYKISEVITVGEFGELYTDHNDCGFCIEGEGRSATIISCDSDGGFVFDGAFAEMRNICIDSPSIGVSVLEKSPYFYFENVYVKHATTYGFYLENSTFTSTLVNCTAQSCPTGFKLIGYHTSLTFISCYANGCTNIGYDMYVQDSGSAGSSYTSLISCACDEGAIGYQFGPGCKALTMLSCGAERQTEKCIHLIGKVCINIDSFFATQQYGKYIYITGNKGNININNFHIHKNGVTNNEPIIYSTGSGNNITIDDIYRMENEISNRLIEAFDTPVLINNSVRGTFTLDNSVATLGTIKNVFSNKNYCAGKIKIWVVYNNSEIYGSSNQGYYELGVTRVDTYYDIQQVCKTIKPSDTVASSPNFTFSFSSGKLTATHAGSNISGTYQYFIQCDGAVEFIPE